MVSKSESHRLSNRLKHLEEAAHYRGYHNPIVDKWMKEMTTDELRGCLASGKFEDQLFERLPESAFDWAKKAGPVAEKLFGNQTYNEWPNWALQAVILYQRKYGSIENHGDKRK